MLIVVDHYRPDRADREFKRIRNNPDKMRAVEARWYYAQRQDAHRRDIRDLCQDLAD